jgi:hypothetical protein
MRSNGRPLHLLLLNQAFCHDFIDGLFSEGSGYCFTITVHLAIVGNQLRIVANVRDHRVEMLAKFLALLRTVNCRPGARVPPSGACDRK